jgi:hypothetical protein
MPHLDGLPYELRRGDSDLSSSGSATGRLYGGRRRADTGRFWVAALQRTLAELGFDFRAGDRGLTNAPAWAGARIDPDLAHPTSPASFDWETEWAVREFQVAATMWVSLANTADRYAGPISGTVDARTAELLRRWQTGNLKCPVRVAGFPTITSTDPATPPTINNALQDPDQNQGQQQQSLWRFDQVDLPDKSRGQLNLVFADDQTGYYAVAGGQYRNVPGRSASSFHVLGRVTRFAGNPNGNASQIQKSRGYGPQIASSDCWQLMGDRSEVLPQFLIEAPSTAAKRATFRVIRAVADQESDGHFEGGNAYDSQVVSYGLMHWTVRPKDGGGELPAFLAYVRYRYPEVFARHMMTFGAGVAEWWRWVAGAVTGRACLPSGERSLRKYDAHATTAGPGGTADRWPPVLREKDPDQRIVMEGDLAYLRNWRAIYRATIASRTEPDYQKAMWDFARIRLRDLLLVQWPSQGTWPMAGGAKATLADTFKTERGIAMVLRWHVKNPGDVVANGHVGPRLRAIYTRLSDVGGPFFNNHDTATWTAELEAKFIDELPAAFIKAVGSDDTMAATARWQRSTKGSKLRPALRIAPHAYLNEPFEINRPAANAPTTPENQRLRLAFLELTDPPPSHTLPPPPPRILNAGNSNLYAVLAGPGHIAGLGAEVSLSQLRAENNQWIGWEVEDRDPAAGRHRLFVLSRSSATATLITVTEIPILRLVRDFAFDPTGLPPPDLIDEPHVWVQNTAADTPADVLATELTAAAGGTPLSVDRLTQLSAILRHLAPFTVLELPAAPTVTVEERDPTGINRWQVNVSGNDHFRSVTIRRSQGKITVDPPGCSCRYKMGANLEADLRTLGFPAPAGAVNRTEALREFQVIARRSKIARLKAAPIGTNRGDLLEAYTLTAEEQALYRYTGPASGKETNETAALIDHWLSERVNWRSPVVFEVKEKVEANWKVVDGLDNVWSLDSANGTGRTVWVTDLSASAAAQPLSAFFDSADVKGWWTRNADGFDPCSATAAGLTPERVRGDDPDGSSTATYPIFKAVMDVACGGNLDGVDARFSDDVLLFGGAALTGQVGAILALARDTDRAAAWLVESEGWQAECGWQTDDSARRGRPLVWGAFFGQPMSLLCPESEPLLFQPAMPVSELKVLRHWHWYYRLARAGRHEPVVPSADPTVTVHRHGYARALWIYALALLRVLTRVPVPGDPGGVLGRVVTTQRGWAVLLYWYLRHPEDLVTIQSAPTNALRTLIETARVGAGGNEAQLQANLVTGLVNLSAGGTRDSVFKGDVATLAGLAALSITPDSWNGSQLDAS